MINCSRKIKFENENGNIVLMQGIRIVRHFKDGVAVTGGWFVQLSKIDKLIWLHMGYYI